MTGTDGLVVGEEVPEFSAPLVAPDADREERSLSELLSDGPVLFCFYTADFSPDCIEEWCSFRDFDWFASTGDVQVVGISKSRSWIHQQFIDYLDLQFPLFSDRDLTIAEAFDVRYRVFGLFERSKRSCFLIDEDRTVRYKWVGQHWLDPTRDVPPVTEIFEGVRNELGGPETETFGFDAAMTD